MTCICLNKSNMQFNCRRQKSTKSGRLAGPALGPIRNHLLCLVVDFASFPASVVWRARFSKPFVSPLAQASATKSERLPFARPGAGSIGDPPLPSFFVFGFVFGGQAFVHNCMDFERLLTFCLGGTMLLKNVSFFGVLRDFLQTLLGSVATTSSDFVLAQKILFFCYGCSDSNCILHLFVRNVRVLDKPGQFITIQAALDFQKSSK